MDSQWTSVNAPWGRNGPPPRLIDIVPVRAAPATLPQETVCQTRLRGYRRAVERRSVAQRIGCAYAVIPPMPGPKSTSAALMRKLRAMGRTPGTMGRRKDEASFVSFCITIEGLSYGSLDATMIKNMKESIVDSILMDVGIILPEQVHVTPSPSSVGIECKIKISPPPGVSAVDVFSTLSVSAALPANVAANVQRVPGVDAIIYGPLVVSNIRDPFIQSPSCAPASAWSSRTLKGSPVSDYACELPLIRAESPAGPDVPLPHLACGSPPSPGATSSCGWPPMTLRDQTDWAMQRWVNAAWARFGSRAASPDALATSPRGFEVTARGCAKWLALRCNTKAGAFHKVADLEAACVDIGMDAGEAPNVAARLWAGLSKDGVMHVNVLFKCLSEHLPMVDGGNDQLGSDTLEGTQSHECPLPGQVNDREGLLRPGESGLPKRPLPHAELDGKHQEAVRSRVCLFDGSEFSHAIEDFNALVDSIGTQEEEFLSVDAHQQAADDDRKETVADAAMQSLADGMEAFVSGQLEQAASMVGELQVAPSEQEKDEDLAGVRQYVCRRVVNCAVHADQRTFNLTASVPGDDRNMSATKIHAFSPLRDYVSALLCRCAMTSDAREKDIVRTLQSTFLCSLIGRAALRSVPRENGMDGTEAKPVDLMQAIPEVHPAANNDEAVEGSDLVTNTAFLEVRNRPLPDLNNPDVQMEILSRKEYTEILPRLFLAGDYQPQRVAYLNGTIENTVPNFGFVVRCSENLSNCVEASNAPLFAFEPRENSEGRLCVGIHCFDLEAANDLLKLKDCCIQIKAKLEKQCNVLVHGQQGVDCSATVVAAFCMAYFDISTTDARESLKRLRPACTVQAPEYEELLQTNEGMIRHFFDQMQDIRVESGAAKSGGTVGLQVSAASELADMWPCPKCGKALELFPASDIGWACDGRFEAGGCQSGITDYYQTSGMPRFECRDCDYDLCERCYTRLGSQVPRQEVTVSSQPSQTPQEAELRAEIGAQAASAVPDGIPPSPPAASSIDSTRASSYDGNKFKAGDRVEIRNLRTSREFNGRWATVLKADHSHLVQIRVDGGGSVQTVKVENIQLLGAAEGVEVDVLAPRNQAPQAPPYPSPRGDDDAASSAARAKLMQPPTLLMPDRMGEKNVDARVHVVSMSAPVSSFLHPSEADEVAWRSSAPASSDALPKRSSAGSASSKEPPKRSSAGSASSKEPPKSSSAASASSKGFDPSLDPPKRQSFIGKTLSKVREKRFKIDLNQAKKALNTARKTLMGGKRSKSGKNSAPPGSPRVQNETSADYVVS